MAFVWPRVCMYRRVRLTSEIPRRVHQTPMDGNSANCRRSLHSAVFFRRRLSHDLDVCIRRHIRPAMLVKTRRSRGYVLQDGHATKHTSFPPQKRNSPYSKATQQQPVMAKYMYMSTQINTGR